MQPKPSIKITVGPIFEKSLSKVRRIPSNQDAQWKLKREITHLKAEISRLNDKIRRMREDLLWEIREWEKTAETGARHETIESIKRRISRLHGAISYMGIVKYDYVDKSESEGH